MKNYINTIIIGGTALFCVVIISFNLISLKKASNNYLTVTGSATKSFTADLIVWNGYFSEKAQTTKEAFEKLKKDEEIVRAYLLREGVGEKEFVFSSVRINELNHNDYNTEGRIIKTTFLGYELREGVKIQSGEVDRIERVSRDITALIDSGVQLASWEPEYYYTKLDGLKLDLIAESTENTRKRAELIAKGAGGRLSRLVNARLGVLQITGENSSTENFNSNGYYDVSNKNKTAFITTHLEYLLK